MKSNINIYSNIHSRGKSIPYLYLLSDAKGRHVARDLATYIGALERAGAGIERVKWDDMVPYEDKRCPDAKSGEMTHGLVRKDDTLVWEGRCEYSECPRFATCSETYKFQREDEDKDAAHDAAYDAESELTEYEWLGDISNVFDLQTDETAPEGIPSEVVIPDLQSFAGSDLYKKIHEPQVIIEADIDSKILVSAAPGSGKTYTVIRRIEHIARQRLVDDFSNVLVLVYTNAAKNEIMKRLEQGIVSGSLPASAASIDIRTFDSLATDYLAASEARFSHLGYNERIRLFNETDKAEDFSIFEYVIIDELQDLVTPVYNFY